MAARSGRTLLCLLMLLFASEAQSFLSHPSARCTRQKICHHRRGRTVTAFSADPQGLWESYMGALETMPLLTKSITAGIILPAGDLAAQVLEKRNADQESGSDRTDIDIARVIRFCIFGLVLQAPWNHVYFGLLDGWLPPTENPFSVISLEKTTFDQFVNAPVFTTVIFIFLGLLEGKSVDSIKLKLQQDFWPTMVANWKLWIPATAINICFCPPELRVLFTNLVFFFWSIFLSIVVNRKNVETEKVGE